VTLVLEVDRSRWESQVAATAARVPRLIPVVKGNGYGLGRDWLAARAAGLATTLAVGTVHEVASVPRGRTALVLTPTLDQRSLNEIAHDVILTIGSSAHLAALSTTSRRVIVKIRSSMHRYGVPVTEHARLVDAAQASGHGVEGVSIHLPLDGDPEEASRLIEAIDPSLPVHLSHVTIEQFTTLTARHPHHVLHLRLGTALWHGRKDAMTLRADVLETESITTGTRVGYRSIAAPHDGTLVMVGCGSSHGVTPLSDGRSPFHFDRRRIDLIEPPHMHTSMALTRLDQPAPSVGDWVDVQRPLIQTTPDSIEWT
jgi:alanine racemase